MLSRSLSLSGKNGNALVILPPADDDDSDDENADVHPIMIIIIIIVVASERAKQKRAIPLCFARVCYRVTHSLLILCLLLFCFVPLERHPSLYQDLPVIKRA